MLDETSARIIMLVAPAGYGKTTLARQWLEGREDQVAWFPATKASSDVAALATGVAEAISSVVPAAGKRMTELLQASGKPDERADELASLLSEDVSQWEQGWLAVDDYQFVMASSAAERFLESFVHTAPVNLLLTTRIRPRWASARRILYDEILEVGASELAMTESEVLELLTETSSSANPHEVLTVSGGWPAVVRLASVAADVRTRRQGLAPTLHDFLAEEIYSALPADLQRAVLHLAIPPTLSDDIVEVVLGAHARSLVCAAADYGLVSITIDEPPSMHPLLRRFLHRKLMVDDTAASVIERVGSFLIAAHRWDEAFSLVERFSLPTLLGKLVSASFRELVSANRVATLAKWLEHARDQGYRFPVFAIAEAEIMLRRGDVAQAENIAVEAAREVAPEDPLRARALLIAGRAAHLRSSEEESYDYLRRAHECAKDVRDIPETLWACFLVASELERPEAEMLLTELEKLPSSNFDRHIRLLTGRAMLASRLGGIQLQVVAPEASKELARRTADPMIRSAFLNRTAYLLVMLGRYEEALSIVETELEEARRSRLAFALPHALLLKAAADAGLHNFATAESAIEAATAHGGGDAFVRMNAAALRARVLCAQHRHEEALRVTSDTYRIIPNRSLYGEYLAARSLALASLGDLEAAAALASDIEGITSSAEPRSAVYWVRAVVALAKNAPNALPVTKNALDAVMALGHLDTLVTAYRSYPALLEALAATRENLTSIESLIRSAKDESIAERSGFRLLTRPSEATPLTPREKEVYALLAQGLSNRAIARRLYISEVTVKVHLRNVFAKLGVHSRTEAAILAARRNVET